jgi:hypothetical protein
LFSLPWYSSPRCQRSPGAAGSEACSAGEICARRLGQAAPLRISGGRCCRFRLCGRGRTGFPASGNAVWAGPTPSLVVISGTFGSTGL